MYYRDPTIISTVESLCFKYLLMLGNTCQEDSPGCLNKLSKPTKVIRQHSHSIVSKEMQPGATLSKLILPSVLIPSAPLPIQLPA